VRRYLIIFFMVFLPFQFAWGAAAGYCTHEKGDQVSHFGHHAHVHKASGASTDSSVSFAGGCDPDCGYCHSGCAQPPPSGLLNLSIAMPSMDVSTEMRPMRFRVPDVIERPNWSLAV
jgi:hypothetical protein